MTALIWLSLCIMGWFAIYSASFDPESPSIFSMDKSYGKQFMWIGVSAVLGAIILLLESTFIKNSSIVFYGGAILLLILVLLIGSKRGGATSWFGFGSFGIQPSEFAKVGIALMLSKYLSDTKGAMSDIRPRLIAIMIIAIPAGLIMLQPDMGTVLLFFGFILVLYREGLSGAPLVLAVSSVILAVISILAIESRIDILGFSDVSGVWLLLFLLLVAGSVAFWIAYRVVLPRFRRKIVRTISMITIASLLFTLSIDFVFNNVFADHQADRIRILLQIEVEDNEAKAWNIMNSKAALGNGGVWGQGFMQGQTTQLRWVPEQKTDFIFCTIGEDWGFVGTTVVVLLFAFLIIRLIIMAERQRSAFSRIYGYCVACLLFMHLFINVGMVIGLAPVIGIPLPFFSYGGSSMMACTILVFLFIKLDSERMIVLR